VYEDSFFPTSLTTFVVGCVLDDSHSNRSEIESWCRFNLHFPKEKFLKLSNSLQKTIKHLQTVVFKRERIEVISIF
jgi:hypothetical protein